MSEWRLFPSKDVGLLPRTDRWKDTLLDILHNYEQRSSRHCQIVLETERLIIWYERGLLRVVVRTDLLE